MKSAGLLLGICLALTTACVSTPLKFPSAPIGPNERPWERPRPPAPASCCSGLFHQPKHRFEDAMRKPPQGRGTRLTDVTSRTMVLGLVLDGFIFKVEGTAVAKK